MSNSPFLTKFREKEKESLLMHFDSHGNHHTNLLKERSCSLYSTAFIFALYMMHLIDEFGITLIHKLDVQLYYMKKEAFEKNDKYKKISQRRQYAAAHYIRDKTLQLKCIVEK